MPLCNKKNHLLSWLVFLPTFIIISFTLILGMFPALIIAFSDKVRFSIGADVWEPGLWMFPILFSNIIVFTIIILHQKNKLPYMLTRLFEFILNFEISNRRALLLIGVMIGAYVILTVGELSIEEPWGDYRNVETTLQNWSFDKWEFLGTPMVYFFGHLSMDIFGSNRVIPFIASITCLFLTYLVTVQISKKRFAGIIALAIVLQSGNFATYDTAFTYTIFWIMFYLLSMYFIFKSWSLSSVSFIPAVLSKTLSMGFLPITILFIAMLNLPKRKKILLLSSYFAVIVLGLVFIQITPIGNFISFDISSFDVPKMVGGFASIVSHFRYDGIIVMFLLPLVVGLFLTSKKGIPNANAVLILISGVILLLVFVPILTTNDNTPYRVLPLVFFFAIGIGTLLSKNFNLQSELLSRRM